jgi:phage terminase large subunit-like protein
MPINPFARIRDSVEHDWRSQARPEQLPPSGDWSTWLILAGRGFGKTRTGAETIRAWAEAGLVSHIALVASTAAAARDVMIEGPAGLLSIASNALRPTFEPSKRRVTWPNGVIATLFASEEPDQLRGPQHGLAWLDELASFKNLQSTWDNLQMGMRIGKRPRRIITTTPRPLKLLRELIENPSTVTTRGSTYDNRANLSEEFFSDTIRKYEGTRLGRQELMAEILDDVVGALWTRDLLEKTRVTVAPPLQRIVVAIDPSVSAGEGADECGLIVAGLGVDGQGYVLHDASAVVSPHEWATKAVGLYKHWNADRIVAEANNGGALVEMTIRAIDRNVAYKAVHASRGKVVRAEPIAALFEQGRAHLVGGFPKLEDELCTFSGGSSDSPDRLDALVWALSELQLNAQRGEFVFGGLTNADRRVRQFETYFPGGGVIGG